MDRKAPELVSKNTNTKPENEGSLIKRHALKLGASMALAATLLAACAPSSKDGGPENSTPPTASESVSPSQNETSDPTPSATSSETDPSNPSNTDTPEAIPTDEHFIQSHSIEEMDAMTLEQFALLSYGDRLAYAVAKESNFPVDNQQQADYTHSHPESIAPRYWQNILGLAINGPDPNERAKVLGAMYYYTSDINTGAISDAYKSNADIAITYGGDGLGSSNGYKYIESGQWQQMSDAANTQLDYIDITYEPIDSHTGASKGSEQTAQAIRAQVKLLDGSVVTCYPMGYSTSGHASPVSGRGY
jgi:hypothetical protein